MRVFVYLTDSRKSCDVFKNDTSGWVAPVEMSSDKYLSFVNLQQDDIDCIYTIQVTTGHVVRIPPFKVDLEGSFGCQHVFLEVYFYRKVPNTPSICCNHPHRCCPIDISIVHLYTFKRTNIFDYFYYYHPTL